MKETLSATAMSTNIKLEINKYPSQDRGEYLIWKTGIMQREIKKQAANIKREVCKIDVAKRD